MQIAGGVHASKCGHPADGTTESTFRRKPMSADVSYSLIGKADDEIIAAYL
jgi:hypothetical protein